MPVTSNKEKNIETALEYIRSAKNSGANIVCLPEIFNCPYDNKYFLEFSESYPNGETIRALSKIASDENIILIGGSIPEYHKGKVYNTCFVFNDDGSLICKHRKVHLFDIDINGEISFKESDTLSPGNEITVFDCKYGRIGVAICYDIRFPDMFKIMALQGAKLVVIPAAFNMTTGPAHWELTIKSRALDNQVYVAAVSPSRDLNSSYIAYGNSCITSPWGDTIAKLDEKPEILLGKIDFNYVDSIREQLPLLKHRKDNIYNEYLSKY